VVPKGHDVRDDLRPIAAGQRVEELGRRGSVPQRSRKSGPRTRGYITTWVCARQHTKPRLFRPSAILTFVKVWPFDNELYPLRRPVRLGPIVTPAYRFALDLFARATQGRPRNWGVSCDELVARADEDVAARDPLLYYAAAVARDLGDHQRADVLLLRALEAGPTSPAWVQEFQLQLTLASALVHFDASAARARLASLPPHDTVPAYPLLAEAAVLLAEGRTEEAAEALRRWRAGAAASSLGPERLAVGNAWALDLVEVRLGIHSPSLDGIVPERHGGATRATMVLLGIVFCAAFAALTVAAAVATAKAASQRIASGVGGALITVLLAAAAVYGGGLVVRGIRGTTQRRPERSAKLEAWMARAWGSLGSWWLLVIALAVGWAASGNLREFLLLRGSFVSTLAWDALALWAAWSVHVAAHECGHAAGAVLAGGRVEEIVVGPVRVFRDSSGWRWSGQRSGAFFSGRVRATIGGASTRARSIALAMACALALVRGGVHAPVAARFLWAGLIAAGWGAISSFAPSRHVPCNDGRLVAAALRGGFWSGSVGQRLAAHLAAKLRVRDWEVSAAQIEESARSCPDGGAWGLLLASSRALDGGDPELARRLLGELTESKGTDTGVRAEALLQAALLDALVDANPSSARRRIAQAQGLGCGAYARLAEAAVACVEGKLAEAREALAIWSSAVATAQDPDSVRVGNHWALDILEQRGVTAPPAEPRVGSAVVRGSG